MFANFSFFREWLWSDEKLSLADVFTRKLLWVVSLAVDGLKLWHKTTSNKLWRSWKTEQTEPSDVDIHISHLINEITSKGNQNCISFCTQIGISDLDESLGSVKIVESKQDGDLTGNLMGKLWVWNCTGQDRGVAGGCFRKKVTDRFLKGFQILTFYCSPSPLPDFVND